MDGSMHTQVELFVRWIHVFAGIVWPTGSCSIVCVARRTPPRWPGWEATPQRCAARNEG